MIQRAEIVRMCTEPYDDIMIIIQKTVMALYIPAGHEEPVDWYESINQLTHLNCGKLFDI